MDVSATWKELLNLWEGQRRPRNGVGLALGGGAVLGAAHVGVLKAMHAHAIRINRISGTSIGAFIAALYAFGKSPSEIEDIITKLDWLDVTSLTLSKYGILKNADLGKQLSSLLGEVDFKQAKIPLFLIATDLATGEKVVLQDGSVAEAVMASSCLPGIFVPVDINNRLLVDGGLVENVPVSPLRDAGEKFIIGVDLSAGRQYQKPQDIVDVFANAIDIAIDNVTRLQTSDADLIIAPGLSSYSRRDTSRIPELIKEGEKAAQQLFMTLRS